MWHSYCKGDVPSQRQMEMLQEEVIAEDPAAGVSDPTSITTPREGPPGSIKTNGFGPLPQPVLNPSTCEENGV